MRRIRFMALLLSAATATLLTLVGAQPGGSASSSERANVTIQIMGDNGGTGALGPKLLVMLCNYAYEPAYVERDVWNVGRWSPMPLHALVYDVASGKRVPSRVTPDLGPRKQLRASDFIGLRRGCYGPRVDLRDFFRISPGKKYRVQFVYQSSAPQSLDGIRPWRTKVISKEVLITVPKS